MIEFNTNSSLSGFDSSRISFCQFVQLSNLNVLSTVFARFGLWLSFDLGFLFSMMGHEISWAICLLRSRGFESSGWMLTSSFEDRQGATNCDGDISSCCVHYIWSLPNTLLVAVNSSWNISTTAINDGRSVWLSQFVTRIMSNFFYMCTQLMRGIRPREVACWVLYRKPLSGMLDVVNKCCKYGICFTGRNVCEIDRPYRRK